MERHLKDVCDDQIVRPLRGVADAPLLRGRSIGSHLILDLIAEVRPTHRQRETIMCGGTERRQPI